MAVQATTARAFKTFRAHHLLAAAAAALAVAAIVALGAVLIASGGSSSLSQAERHFVGPVGADEPAVVYYLVGSEAQKASVLQAEDEAAQIRVTAGDVSAQYATTVSVVNNAASEELAQAGFVHANEVRASLGLPEMTLVDLRP